MKIIACPSCGGTGLVYPYAPLPIAVVPVRCFDCGGRGTIIGAELIWKRWGGFITHWLDSNKLTLRSGSKLLGVDVGNLSRAERGIINPSGYILKIRMLEAK